MENLQLKEVEKQFNLASVFLEDIEFRNMLSEEGDSLVQYSNHSWCWRYRKL